MEQLTPRQEEVMRLMARGLTNGQIAARMGITLAGAKWHVSEVLSKLGVASREEAVSLWRAENGAVSRLRVLTGALFGTKAMMAGAAVAGAAGVFLTAALVMGGGVDEGAKPDMAGDGSALVVDGRGGYVYGGNCGEWSATYDGVPLCGPIANSEARYVVEVDGAKITVRGLAGESIQYVQLLLGDGGAPLATMRDSQSARIVTESADGGTFFLIDGTFTSAPVGIRFFTEEQAQAAADGTIDGMLAQHDFGGRLDPQTWPTAEPPDVAMMAEYTIVQDGNCVSVVSTRWGQPEYCYDHADRRSVFPYGSSSFEDGGYFAAGIVPVSYDRLIQGFDDGTLVEADIRDMLGADGSAFRAYVVASRNPFPNSQLWIKLDGTIESANTISPPRSRAWLLADSFPPSSNVLFDDGVVSVAANPNDCLSWVAPIAPVVNSFTCFDAHALRNLATVPVLRIINNSSFASRLSAIVVVSPPVDTVEVVDGAGNVHRELAKAISSSPQGLKFVYFDREVAAAANTLRVLDAAGNILEAQEGALAVQR